MGVIKWVLLAWKKTQTFEFSLLVDFLRILKKIAIFEIFGELKNVPLNPCQIHLMRPVNERYNSKQLY